MAFDSYAFFALALVAISALRLCPPGLGKDAVLCVINLVFLASFVATPVEAVPLLAFLAVGYLAICAAGKFRHTAVIGILVCSIIAVFIWLKQYAIVANVPGLSFVYLTIGLSYILFRVLHLIVDVAEGSASVPSPLSYFNYTTFFLTFVSGPIALYRDFAGQMRQPASPMTPETLDRGLWRAATGYLFLLVLSVPLAYAATKLQAIVYASNDQHAWLKTSASFAAAAAVYLLYLYVNFVAYMNIVIGIGQLAGFSLPENFNKPYNATNFLDLWARWHITLSQWFKLYLFNPLLKAMAARWGGGAASNYLGAVAFFVTFGVMGVWHGTTGIFLAYGLALGLGATANKLWQVELIGRLGKSGYRALCARAWYRHFARSSTLAYFAMALTCLWITPARSSIFAVPFTWVCALTAFLLLAVLGAAAAAVQQFSAGRLTALGLSGAAVADRFARLHQRGAMVWNAAMIFLIVLLSTIANGYVPEIVYKGF